MQPDFELPWCGLSVVEPQNWQKGKKILSAESEI